VSGTGFIPSNSNAGTSDASIIEECTDHYLNSDNALLVQPLTAFFDFAEFLHQFGGAGWLI
jgi:hypothetical protein